MATKKAHRRPARASKQQRQDGALNTLESVRMCSIHIGLAIQYLRPLIWRFAQWVFVQLLAGFARELVQRRFRSEL
ncbi:MAG TPA: hypothetical protein VD971_09920 [Phycisphaerales bacterium]|nr:hypothetical protein [Phycisphaerales bacterium]